MIPAPILLFVYNRPAHLQQAIKSLLLNDEAIDSLLFIYSDAAKDEDDLSNVEEVRQYIHTIKGFASVTIIERENNWGLAQNIIDGVTTQVSRFGRVIVLEDDLILAPYFLRFMNDALETYKDEPKVGHIQACDFTLAPNLPDTFLIKWTGSWGWATWDRAWKYFNPDGKVLLKELTRRKLTRTFDFNGSYPFTRMLRRQVEGKNNSWAIRWNASLFLNDILSLNVGKSLVKNNGFDGSGTNCGGGGLYDSSLWVKPLPIIKAFPIKENDIARRALAAYYERSNCFRAKVIRRIKRTLRGDFGA
ncbi:MAG: glycosyltransferase [Bacteroidaceae bacterium]|nr:glycosyltransferase [Bacteroidaceae bacterium]